MIIVCPKCGGSGKIIHYEAPHANTAAGSYGEICTSCGGKGYVTDKDELASPIQEEI